MPNIISFVRKFELSGPQASGQWVVGGHAEISPMAQQVKNPPATQETWIQSLGQEDPLEKEIATHSRILAWKTPWTEEFGGLQSKGSNTTKHADMAPKS